MSLDYGRLDMAGHRHSGAVLLHMFVAYTRTIAAEHSADCPCDRCAAASELVASALDLLHRLEHE